jgi:hypothetical protein
MSGGSLSSTSRPPSSRISIHSARELGGDDQTRQRDTLTQSWMGLARPRSERG